MRFLRLSAGPLDGEFTYEMTQAQKVLLVSFCVAGVTQVALSVYRSRILDEPSRLGVALGFGLVVSAALRVVADRFRLLQVVSATLGVLASLFGLWLSYGIVDGVPISLLQSVGAASTLLTFGIVLAVPGRRQRGRAFVASMFFLCFLALEAGVTLDARWEAEQRTRGFYRTWR